MTLGNMRELGVRRLPMRAPAFAAAATTLVAYLGLGALSYHVAVAHRFRSWMPWAFVTGDAAVLLMNVVLNVFNTGIRRQTKQIFCNRIPQIADSERSS
jgi:hypothetical protein